ncbi:MAG: glycosyltransferase family 2 protein [Actinomycetota bacterium]
MASSVTVVVTTRDSAATIARCLLALLEQTQVPEIIVVDNHSTDETVRIAKALGCRVIVSGDERSRQRNVGAREADTEWLLFLDADMICGPRVVEACLEAGRAGSDAATIPQLATGVGWLARSRAFEKQLYVGRSEMEAPRFFSTRVFLDLGGYDEDLVAGEDWDIAQRCRAAGVKVGSIGEPITHLDGRMRLIDTYRKFRYYAPSLRRYRRKYKELAGSHMSPIRPALLRGWRGFLRHPALAAGIAALKGAELLGFLTGKDALRSAKDALRRGLDQLLRSASSVGEGEGQGAERSRAAAAVPYVVIVLAAAATLLSWYRGHQLLWGADTNMPLSLRTVGQYFHVTDATLGSPDARKLPYAYPVALILWLWGKAHIPYSAAVVQHLGTFGLLAISGCAMYAFLRRFLPRLAPFACLGGALFFMFNLFSLIAMWTPLSNLVFHYSLLPVVMLAWVGALRRASPLWGLGAAAIWTLTLTPAYITTPVAVTDVVLLGGIAVVELRRATGGRRRLMIGTTAGAIVGAWLVFNLFWILPLTQYTGVETTRGLSAGRSTELFALNSTTFTHALRLSGYWGLTSSYQGSPYFPWASTYTSGWGALAGFALPLLAFLGLAFSLLQWFTSDRMCRSCGSRQPFDWSLRRRRVCAACGESAPAKPRMDDTSRYLVFFGLLLVVACVLMTGPNPPFGFVKTWAMTRTGLFSAFRSVYQRFGEYAALAYAPLVAAGLSFAMAVTRARIKAPDAGAMSKAVGFGLGLIVALLLALPMWAGSLYDRSGVIPSKRIDVPSDYTRVGDFLSGRSGDFEVLPVPRGPSAVITLRWHGGSEGFLGVDPLKLLTNKPLLVGDASAPYLDRLAVRAVHGGSRGLAALRFLDTRFIVVHEDADRSYLSGQAGWQGLAVHEVDRLLQRTAGIRLVMDTPHLRVYEVLGWRPSRVFAVHGYSGRSIYDMPASDIDDLGYRVTSPGRIEIETESLQTGDIVVLNAPFDQKWEATSGELVNVAPGLIGYRFSDPRDAVTVRNSVERRFPILLAFSGMALGATVLLFVGLLIVRRRPQRSGNHRGGTERVDG